MDNYLPMSSNKKMPIITHQINESYIIGIYQGSISEYDIVLKYRQKDLNYKNGWSRLRTPKHIHWAIDVLLKSQFNKKLSMEFLELLINYWENVAKPISSQEKLITTAQTIFNESENEENLLFNPLTNIGDYSIKFLLITAKLLMHQEKTNNPKAYMFKQLLDSIKSNDDIFKIVSIATHKKRL